MKQAAIIFFSLFVIKSSYCQPSRKVGTAGLNGEQTIILDQLTKPAAILVWYDKYYDEHSIKPCGTHNAKKFGTIRQLQIDEPTLLVLPIGIQVPYLVYPSDTLVFYDKGKTSPPKTGNPTLRHKRLQTRTQELKFFEEIYDSLGPCYGIHSYSIPGEIQNYNEALEFQKGKLNSRMAFLDRRYSRNKISKKLFDFARSYFRCKFYDDVITAFRSKKFFDSSQKQEILFLADSLIAQLKEEGESINYAWQDALVSYVELKVGDEKINSQNFESHLERISSRLEGRARNFAIFYFYKFLLNYRNVDFLSVKIDYFKSLCTDQDYIDYISGSTSFVKKSVLKSEKDEATDVIFDVKKNQTKLASVIESLKGKVVYIDFWASWCIPCLEEIPFSKKLIERFNGKEIAFLFLSMDSYITPWITAIKKNELTNLGTHYLIGDSKNNYFTKKYNIGPIPRYMLLNKNGDVVNSDSPRPSEERASKLIEEILKENK